MNPLIFEETLRVTYRKKKFILINDCEQNKPKEIRRKANFIYNSSHEYL